MASTGTSRYTIDSTNLYSRQRQGEYRNSNNNYSSGRRAQHRFRDEKDGEDEKQFSSLSDRIKKLSSSKVLKDNSYTTHNNNEPFSYLHHPSETTNKRTHQPIIRDNVPRTGREVIYAQVVVDPDERKNRFSANSVRNKRTVHRSYNSANPQTSLAPKMRARNVTTVLLNSSSDDIPSSLNNEVPRYGLNTETRFRSSSSPLLDYGNDYYPKSPGIVKHFQNGYGARSRYETNSYQRNSSDYHHLQSDEDDYLGRNKYSSNHNRYGHREKSPFDHDDHSDDFYNSQYKSQSYGKSASMNYLNGYKGNVASFRDYRIEEEDESDVTRNTKFEDRRSKTLDRDTSFRNYGKNRLSSADFIERSKTLDSRLNSLRERSNMLHEHNYQNESTKNQNFDFKVTSSTKNTESKSKTAKERLVSTGNLFATLLRKNKKADQKYQTAGDTHTLERRKPDKKPMQTGFLSSFLEKKRNKKLNAEVKSKNDSSTYQSFGDWPASGPPALTIEDYSSTLPKHFGDSNIDTEDSNAHGSDSWKKPYGSDAKVKRRWTMREPNSVAPVSDTTTRTLGRKSTSQKSEFENVSTIDRRKQRSFVENRDNRFSTQGIKPSYCDENDSLLKVPGTSSKFNSMSRNRYTPEKSYEDYSRYHTGNRDTGIDSGHKGYNFGGTPNSSGSEGNNRGGGLVNGSSRSVYLHEAAVIPEMPRTRTGSVGGGASISGLSGRRTLSKDEISNYSGSRKEAKQLSRSLSMAHPWGPTKHYKDKYKELDYSSSNHLHLPPRPPSRSPSGSVGLNVRSKVVDKNQSKVVRGSKSKPPNLPASGKPLRKSAVSSSSVESLLRQDTPTDQNTLKKKVGAGKLSRSKSMSVSQATAKDSKPNNRFSTFWFNKRSSPK